VLQNASYSLPQAMHEREIVFPKWCLFFELRTQKTAYDLLCEKTPVEQLTHHILSNGPQNLFLTLCFCHVPFDFFLILKVRHLLKKQEALTFSLIKYLNIF